MSEMIEWTLPKLKRFIKAVAAAEGETLVFDGHTFDRRYAQYLIEYLLKYTDLVPVAPLERLHLVVDTCPDVVPRARPALVPTGLPSRR